MILLESNGNKFIDTKIIENLFTQGEEYSDIIRIIIPAENNGIDLRGSTFTLRTLNEADEMTDSLLDADAEYTGENIALIWKPIPEVTNRPGLLCLELTAQPTNGSIVKFKMPAVYIKRAVFSSIRPTPDILEQKIAEMNRLLREAGSGAIAEVTDARKSELTDTEYGSLNERLNADNSCLTERIEEYNKSLKSQIKDISDSLSVYATQLQLSKLAEAVIELRDAVGESVNALSELVDLPENEESTGDAE